MLSNLKGVEKKEVTSDFFSNATQGMKLVKEGKYAISGEQNGSISVYKDDEGILRGYRYRNFACHAFIATLKPMELRAWLLKEIPKTK